MASNPQTSPNTLPNTTSGTNPDISHSTMSVAQQHEADLLRALEISPYKLSFLKKHLLDHGWIPNTSDEEVIEDTVFKFRESFFADDRHKFINRVDRLNTLFDPYPDDEEFYSDYEDDLVEAYNRRLNRETAKYNAVRFLITDLAIRQSRKRENGGRAS